MTTKTVDEWAAEQCGLCVMTGLDDKEYFYRPNTTEPPYDFEWTIQDPRCREIAREHFGISTKKRRLGGYSCYYDPLEQKHNRAGNKYLASVGVAIQDAEIEIILTIYEASQ